MKHPIKNEKEVVGSFMTKFSRIWDYTTKNKKKSIIALVIIALGSITVSIVPFILGKYMDHISINDGKIHFDIGSISAMAIAVVVMLLLWFILSNVGRRLYVKSKTMNKMRCELLRKIDNRPIEKIEGRSAGEFVGYVSNEMVSISNLVYDDLPKIVECATLILIILVMMLITNVQLGLIYVILFLVTFYLIRNIGRKVRKDTQRNNEALRRMNSYLDDACVNQSLIKLYGLEKIAEDRFEKLDGKVSHSYMNKYRGTGRVAPIGRIIENSGFVVFSIVGASMMSAGFMTVGMFITFTSYVSLIGNPLFMLSESIHNVQNEMVSFKHLQTILDSEEIDRSGRSADEMGGTIAFENVYFSYGDYHVLDDLSFNIHAGEKVALRGRAGSGRTTAVDLIMGIRYPSEGRVKIDGVEVREYDKNSLRHQVVLASSVPWVFNGTIMENIGYANEAASPEEITEASKLFGLDQMLKKHNFDLYTLLGEGGVSLSPGESQLLALVRLYIRNPKVVIFDGTFSRIDPYTMSKIAKPLKEFLKGKTVILISDDTYDYLDIDRSISMEKGSIV